MAETQTPDREFTLADVEAFIASAPWTAAKWAKGTDARHEYVMFFDVDSDDYRDMVRFIRREGYKARWNNPETGKTYTNTYLEIGEWTYWWIPRCLNREHVSTPTRREPGSKAEAEAQLSL